MATWEEGFEGFAVGAIPYQFGGGGAAVTAAMARTGVHSLGLEDATGTINEYGQVWDGPVSASGWSYLTPDSGVQQGNTADFVLVSKDYIVVASYWDSPFLFNPFHVGVNDNPVFGGSSLAASAAPVTVAGWYEFFLQVDGSVPPSVTAGVRDNGGTSLVTWTGTPAAYPGVGALFGLTLDDNQWALITDTTMDAATGTFNNWWDDLRVVTGGGRARPVRMYPRHDGRNLSSAPRVVGGIQ